MFKTWLTALGIMIVCATSAMAEEIVLRVAHDATWPPMEFMDENRKIVGYSVDYIDAVAKEAGFKVEHHGGDACAAGFECAQGGEVGEGERGSGKQQGDDHAGHPGAPARADACGGLHIGGGIAGAKNRAH